MTFKTQEYPTDFREATRDMGRALVASRLQAKGPCLSTDPALRTVLSTHRAMESGRMMPGSVILPDSANEVVDIITPATSWMSGESRTDWESRSPAAWYAASMEAASAGINDIGTRLNGCPTAVTRVKYYGLLPVSTWYQGAV